ncbi:SDR family NAD(P)-dependent oxidoreductase [Mycolicibacterium thermoresistibile]|uniref:Short chain dehydrogenase family protein 39 n=2 Tax=Mycolicibacterium thermoresistibile TaxID=1797 RepID=G7CFW1_MYCT3|nr:SDR family NAD(P)-dependent oxidoreductase [Mycolicibacterium thermoresistibile]EHI13390.1 short chain dehydrogenase family protein 39 [Mycolicibacterium thermoresistibile ATCC 19527]MCV7189182.1 SDR family NAD(P)-dependent oxidoreductase [Mycolicibacterium thermoresistibile]GAT14628.1 dehydrogenase [Mycolicibacterium thermoresistibile]SNW19855.1 dehydrogenase [Mycolicibacterium thermoresistibile]
MGVLDGRTALVTGAGRGIGAAIAEGLAAEGATVMVSDAGVAVDGTGRDPGPAESVVAAINQQGGKAFADVTDITDFAACEALIARAADTLGGLDVVVNAAGILRDGMVFKMSEQDWDAVISVHLKGTFNVTRHAAAWWRENRGGQYRLINFTSMSGLQGAPSQPNYAAAKMGIVGLTFSCANALRNYGVTSNAIAPIAGTRMTQGIKGGGSMDYSDSNVRLSPKNCVPPVVYLASEQSDWLNRRVIFAGNGRISLMTNPVIEREIVSASGTWDIPTAFAEIESSFKEAILWPNIFDKPPAK